MLHTVVLERSYYDRTTEVHLVIKIPDEVLENSPRHTNLLDHVRNALTDQVVMQVTSQFGVTDWRLIKSRLRDTLQDPSTSADPVPPPDPGRRALDL